MSIIFDEKNKCTCPSGDGSLRWPCPVHGGIATGAPDLDKLEAQARAALTHPSVSASQPEPEWAIIREVWHGSASDWRPTTAGYARGQLKAAAQFGGNSDKTVEVRWLVPLPGSVSMTRAVLTDTTQQPSAAPSVQPAGAPAQAQPDLLAEIDEELAGSDLNIGRQRRLLQKARAALSASPSAPAVQAEPTDEQIIAALHSCGIDTRPSKYGFPEVQVDGTNVPNLRRVFAKLYTGAAPAGAAQEDDQEFDRNAERITREMGLGGGRINPNATSVTDLFIDDEESDGAAQTTTASASGERQGWEAAAKALDERAAGHYRNKNYSLQDECLQCASMLHDMKPADRAPAPSRSAAPAEPEAATPDEVKQAVRDAVTEALTGLYYCGRVWSAWNVGTMSQDDFSPANEDDDIIASVAEAAMNAMVLASMCRAAPAGGEDARDAARYRWLREQDWFAGPLCVLRDPKRVLTKGIGLGADCPSHHRLDAAIDAALSTMQQSTDAGGADK